MIADDGDLQESEAAEIYVTSFKNEEVFVKENCEFLCASATLRLPSRPRPSSTAEGNLEREDDVELKSKKTTKKEAKQNIRGPCVEIFYRHHEEPRLKIYDPDYQTFRSP